MRRRLLFGLGSFAFAWLLTGTVSGWAQSTPTAIEQFLGTPLRLKVFRRSDLLYTSLVLHGAGHVRAIH